MVGVLLVILSEDSAQQGKVSTIQIDFADCLPDIKDSVS